MPKHSCDDDTKSGDEEMSDAEETNEPSVQIWTSPTSLREHRRAYVLAGVCVWVRVRGACENSDFGQLTWDDLTFVFRQ